MEGRAQEVDSVTRENVELKRKNEVLKSKIEGKYVELDLRVLELELDMAFLRSKELLLPDGAGEIGVPSEAKGFDKDYEDGQNGNDSQAGGSASASRKENFRKRTCGGVLRGDGCPALKEVVEIIDLDDDSTEPGCLSGNDLPSQKLTGEEHLGDNNQEERKSELKRKGRESLREREIQVSIISSSKLRQPQLLLSQTMRVHP